jgi:hypothetical protein
MKNSDTGCPRISSIVQRLSRVARFCKLRIDGEEWPSGFSGKEGISGVFRTFIMYLFAHEDLRQVGKKDIRPIPPFMNETYFDMRCDKT